MPYRYRRAGSPVRITIASLAAAAAALAAAGPAQAGGTPAGTQISNTATATWELPSGDEESVSSNTVTLTVDELLDVGVAWEDGADLVTAPGVQKQILKFTITNGGNGPEAFTLATVAGGDGDFDPTVTLVVLDDNGNGAYDAGLDKIYVAGVNDPELDPDQSLSVFVLSNIPAAAADGQRGRAQLKAEAVTGKGAPGTSFAGLGQGGGNAVVGATGAEADDAGWYRVSSASVSFVKSAAVADPFGGTGSTPGAVVTYTLTATATGSGTLANVRVADPIPTGTTYAPGSITLDGAAMTDAEDGDAGRFTGTGIAVGLGSLTGGAVRTVTFKVKID